MGSPPLGPPPHHPGSPSPAPSQKHMGLYKSVRQFPLPPPPPENHGVPEVPLPNQSELRRCLKSQDIFTEEPVAAGMGQLKRNYLTPLKGGISSRSEQACGLTLNPEL